MFCNNCGEHIKEGQKFCTKCGTEAKPRLVGAMKPSTAMPVDAKPVPWASKRLKIIIWVFVGLIILSVLSSVVLASLNTAREKGLVAQGLDWATLTSVDGKFVIELPRNPEHTSFGGSNDVTGYSYIASEKDENVYYLVKYVDFSIIAEEDKVDFNNLDSDEANSFLKELADSTVEEYKLTDFSNQLITSHNHKAIKFDGDISDDNETVHYEGLIILVGDSAYYVIAITEQGYISQFDRVVSSLQIN